MISSALMVSVYSDVTETYSTTAALIILICDFLQHLTVTEIGQKNNLFWKIFVF